MDTQPETTASSFVYNRIPTKVSRKDFNRYIEPHLHRPKKGPKPKLSLYKIFNYILYLPIRPIRFRFPEFQAVHRERHPIPAVAGYPPVTLTRA
jgi:hypothetical protein